MGDVIAALLKDVFTSKKALATLAGLLMILLKWGGVPIEETTLHEILSIIGVYIVGQGVADAGKSAAKMMAPDEEKSGQ